MPASTSSRSSQRPRRVAVEAAAGPGEAASAARRRWSSPPACRRRSACAGRSWSANCRTPSTNSTEKAISPTKIQIMPRSTSQPGGSSSPAFAAARRPSVQAPGSRRNSLGAGVELGQRRQLVVLAAGRHQVGHLDDPPRAVGVPVELDDQVDGRVDLVAEGRRTGPRRRSSWPASPAGTARRTALLACTVVSEPSWPVFIACSMSSASPPRTSPTMMRSGRMRSALRTRSRIVTAPRPSTFGRPGLQPDHVLLVEATARRRPRS